MARLLFIENREKTLFWRVIAARLAGAGHEVAWMVQNPLFARGLPGRVHRLPLPTSEELDGNVEATDYPALSTDRGRDYFGAGTAHYPHYVRQIGAVLDAEVPDLVIGEVTLFHELLTEHACTARGIAYVHPVGERYPARRFALFDGTDQRPFVASGDRMTADAALDLAARIGSGHVVPTYMEQPGRLARARHRANWLRYRAVVLAGRLAGERYNTPTLMRKLALERIAHAERKAWAAGATAPEKPQHTLLYPLQMQPENTIDVWGRPHSDQVAVIDTMLAAIPPDWSVAVKTNPKSYYELSPRLVDHCARDPRIVMLPSDWGMNAALAATAGTVTITGTVGYEAVCGKGRCLSIGHPVLSDHLPRFAAKDVATAARALVTDPMAGSGSAQDGAALMQLLTARSFAGTVSDPISDPEVLAPDNVARVCAALGRAIDHARNPSALIAP